MSSATFPFGFDPDRPYRVKELGGTKRLESRGLLAMSYDSVIRKIVNNPRYGKWISATPNRTRRSTIHIMGQGVIQWLEDNRLDRQ